MKRMIQIIAVVMIVINMMNPYLALAVPNQDLLVGHIATPPKTVTKNVQVRVKVQKFKIFRSNPHRITKLKQDLTTDVEDDNIAPLYHRRDLVKLSQKKVISEDIRWRLFLARTSALVKYRMLHIQ
jgi:hypothetical protein